jgi:hypothetical protein
MNFQSAFECENAWSGRTDPDAAIATDAAGELLAAAELYALGA